MWRRTYRTARWAAGKEGLRHITGNATEELKAGQFQPEFSGKMNFYLSAIDDLLRHPDDRPSIGIILCKSKNSVVAEYALRDIRKPVGISEYRLTEALPKQLRGSLPTVRELETELQRKGDEAGRHP